MSGGETLHLVIKVVVDGLERLALVPCRRRFGRVLPPHTAVLTTVRIEPGRSFSFGQYFGIPMPK
jgi:hypothetical protein